MMRPYNSTRYHLREWQEPGVDRPRTKEELFNLRHSQMRVVVERIFGVLKRKFKILSKPPEGYSLKHQTELVKAVTAVFNFISERDRKNDRDFFRRKKDLPPLEESVPPPISALPLPTAAATAEIKRAQKRRDDIAEKMWLDYQACLSARERSVSRVAKRL